MPLTIAELETELTGNSSHLDAELERANRKLLAFGEKEYPDAQLRVNIDTAKVALRDLERDWKRVKGEMEAGARVGTSTGEGKAPGAGLRPSTAKPERIAATTAATVEQIERTSNARREAETRRTATTVEGIAAKSAARRAQIELLERQKTDSAVDRVQLQAQERRQQRLSQIEDEFWKRQNLKAQARAPKAAPTLTQRASRLQNAGQDDVQAGMMMSGAFAAPLIAGGLLVTKIGIDAESAWAGVTKTVDGTEEELQQLQKTLRGMASGKKAIPIDVVELAAIAEAAGQLGIKTPAIAGFTRVMADLGKTTNLTSAQAADSLARLANIIQLPQTQFDRLGSTIVELGNKTAATESEIVEMAQRLAGAGHQIGLNASEILSFAASLSSVGIEAEAGGTAFSRFFISVEQAVREGGANLDLFAKVAGTTTARFKQAFAKDAANALVSVTEGLGRMQKAGGNVFGTLDKLGLGEVRVRDSLLRAAGAGDLFTTSLRTGERAWRQNIALTVEAEKRYATTASQLKILQNRLKDQALEISDRVLPVVNKLIRAYGDDLPQAIGAATSVFASLPEGAQKGALAALGLLALVGPAKIATGNVKLLGSAFTGMWAAAAANPAVAVAAVVALTAGYLILNKTVSNIAQVQAQAEKNTNDLTSGFKRMLDVLPDGSKHAVEIRKIRDEIAQAGTDVNKLNQAAIDLAKTRARLNVEVKNPDLALVMSSEMDKAQAALDRQKLTATVIVRPFIEQAQRAVSDSVGITKEGGGVSDINGGAGLNLLSGPLNPWGYTSAGQKVNAAIGSKANNVVDWLSGQGWNGDAGDGGPDPRYDSRLGHGQETDAAKALRLGSENAKRMRAQARSAQAREGFNKFRARNSAVNGVGAGTPSLLLPSLGDGLPTGRTASGDQTFVLPGTKAVDQTPAGVEAARARLVAQKAGEKSPAMPASKATAPSTFAGVSSGDADKDAEKARRAQEAQQRRDEDAQRRREALLSAWRTKQAQSLDESARPWEHLNESIGQMGLRLNEFDAATDGARARAKLLSKEFSSLPAPIQAATVQMATLLDQVEEMGKQRDGLRNSNAGTLSSLLRSGTGIGPFLKAIRSQEGAYDFGGRIGAARTRASAIGSVLGPMAAEEASRRTKRAEQLREQNDTQRFTPLGGEGGAPFKGVVSGADVLRAAKDAENAKQPAFRQTCAWAVTHMYKALGVEIHTQNNNWAANLVNHAKKNWRRVDAATAPPGSLLAEPSQSANSGYHVTMSRGGRSRAGSNLHKLQLGSAGRNALAFIPPELDPERRAPRGVSGKPAIGTPPRSRVQETDNSGSVGLVPVNGKNGDLGYTSPDNLNRVRNHIAGKADVPQKEGAGKDAKKPLSRPAPQVKVAPSPLESPTLAKPGTGLLLPYTEAELKALLRAWGPTVTEGSARPGVSNTFRLQKQDDLLTRLGNGERLSPARIKADRAAANVADASSDHSQTTKDVKRATDEMARSTANQIKVLGEGKRAFDASNGSMAAYERATFIVQKRLEAYSSEQVVALWNQKRFHEANALAAKQVASAALVYDKGKGDDHDLAAARAATALADETGALNAQRDYLAQNAGKPEATIARGMDEIARSWQEYRRLVDEEGMESGAAKALAAQTAAQGATNAATREAIDLQRQLNAEQAHREDDEAAQNDEARLRADGLNARQRERELAGLSAERAKARELEAAVLAGQMSPEFADASAWQAGQEARSRFDRDARGRRDDGADGDRSNHRARMELLGGQTELNNRFNANDPELGVQLRLLERRNELNAQNKMLDDSEQIDVKARLDDYEAEIRAEDALGRLTVQRQAVQSALENTLSLQKEHELQMAHTAAERLAIEQKYDAMLRGRRGETVSPEEAAEQAKQRAQTTANAQFDNFKNQATRMRDLISSSMDEGGKKGMGGILGHWAQGIAQMMQKATFDRIAGKITKGIFGVDVSDGNGDILDVLNGKTGRQKTDDVPQAALPAVADIPSILDGLHSHRRAKVADGVDTAPHAVKRRGVAGVLDALSGSAAQSGGGQIAHAVLHIGHAVEHIQSATINTRGGASQGTNNSGSAPSWEQALGVLGGAIG